MPKAEGVPVTPEVLSWAIAESGHSLEMVAEKVGVSPQVLGEWLHAGTDKRPSPSQVKELATALNRTPATFLLPRPPARPAPRTQFRSRGGRNAAAPVERRYLREAARLQRTASWLVRELERPLPRVPAIAVTADAESVAHEARAELSATAPPVTQVTPAAAFRAWRSVLEAAGLLVFAFPMGRDGIAGFSLWDDRAPVIAVNTAQNHQARSFTLFHEYGHLLTRTSSLCLEADGAYVGTPLDGAERWCEEFAAAVLLPWNEVVSFLRGRGYGPDRPVIDLETPKAMARHFNSSLRAATLRLIANGMATWDLYRQIPRVADAKEERGGTHNDDDDRRDRLVIRGEQYGQGTVDLFLDAAHRNVLSRTDVLDYLDVPDTTLDRVASRL